MGDLSLLFFFQVPTIPLSSVPFFPVEDFSPQQIVKNVKDEARWTGDPWNNQEDE